MQQARSEAEVAAGAAQVNDSYRKVTLSVRYDKSTDAIAPSAKNRNARYPDQAGFSSPTHALVHDAIIGGVKYQSNVRLLE
jgi:hypothetical protein